MRPGPAGLGGLADTRGAGQSPLHPHPHLQRDARVNSEEAANPRDRHLQVTIYKNSKNKKIMNDEYIQSIDWK